MSERKQEYSFTDEYGDKYKLNYIARTCLCMCDCNEAIKTEQGWIDWLNKKEKLLNANV